MMKCVSRQDVSTREGFHVCKSSSQLAYLSCWREREVIRTTSVLFICVSKLLSPAVCSTLTSVKGKTLFLWQPLCSCNRKWLCLSSRAAYTHSHTHTFYSRLPLCHLSRQILLWCSALFFIFLNLFYVPRALWAGGNLYSFSLFYLMISKSVFACVQIFNALQLGKKH